MEYNVALQLASHIARPFINTRVSINTRRKCTASAFKHTAVYKRAIIYKRLDPYLVTCDAGDDVGFGEVYAYWSNIYYY